MLKVEPTSGTTSGSQLAHVCHGRDPKASMQPDYVGQCLPYFFYLIAKNIFPQ